MPLAKQHIGFTFGAVQGSRYKRGLRPGELVEAINVRQIVEDGYRKRPGYDRVVPTASSGSVTTPWESLAFDGSRAIGRDAVGAAWMRNGAAWESKGTQRRALPEMFPAKTAPRAARPYTVAVGDTYWVFTPSNFNDYQYTIFNKDGSVARGATTVSPGSGIGLEQVCAVAAGDYVWLLYFRSTATDPTVYCHRFTIASPGTAPTATTYSINSGTDIYTRGIDMRLLANGEIAVAVVTHGGPSTSVGNLEVSYLNPATGAAKASPARVVTAYSNDTAGSQSGQPAILSNSDGAGGSWFVAFWGPNGNGFYTGGTTSANLILATITSSTLATALQGIATTNNTNPIAAQCGGYIADNGDKVLFSSSDSYTGTPTQPRPWLLRRHVWDGATTTTTTIRRYSYLVSRPQKIGSNWYLLTGYDDGPATGFLRSYFLIDSDGNILSQAAYGQAAAAGNRADPAITLESVRSFTVPLIANGSVLDCALLFNTGSGGGSADVNDYAPSLFKFDLDAAYAPPAKLRHGSVAWPGGTPAHAGAQDNLAELALMLSPVNATFVASSGADLSGATVVQYLYRLVSADGRIYRSSPSPAQTQTFKVDPGNKVVVKPLTHLLPGVTAQIEIYLSDPGQIQPRLHAVANNDTTVDTISVNVQPNAVSASAETIYTFGAGLDNAPLPPSRAITHWRSRDIVAHGSEIWPSLEIEDGLGPRFNEALVTTWTDGSGDILAIVPIDWNYCAVFKKDAIGVISGGGPNLTPGGGVSGNYEVQTLRSKKSINARSVVTGSQGAYLQSEADGRIYCVTTGLEVSDISQGMESYITERVKAAVHVERDRQIHFHMDSGAIMVLDYAHPTPEQPAGRWMRWTSAGLLEAAGAIVDGDGAPVHLETLGAIRSQGAGWTDATATDPAAVLMALTTGDLAAAGQLRGEYRLDAIHFEGERIATNTFRVTVTSDYDGTPTVHTSAAIAASPQEAYIRPAGHARVRATRIKIEETVSAGEGFIFQGIVLVIQQRGRTKFPSNSRRIA